MGIESIRLYPTKASLAPAVELLEGTPLNSGARDALYTSLLPAFVCPQKVPPEAS